jgi:hypothetical protein
MNCTNLAAAFLFAGGLFPMSAQNPAGPASFGYNEAQSHELKPHRGIIPTEGVRSGFHQFGLKLIVSPTGQVTEADAKGMPEELKHWPQVKGEILQWKFAPFLVDGTPVTASVEEYLDLVPLERFPKTHVAPPVLRPDSKVAITLQRTTCYGTCPVYTVTVSTTGIVFNGDRFVAATGRHTAPVDPDVVRKLAARFIAADFYSMDPRYVASVTDNPDYYLSITIDGRKKEVHDYVGQWEGMPAVVVELEDAVDELAQTSRWIKRGQ